MPIDVCYIDQCNSALAARATTHENPRSDKLVQLVLAAAWLIIALAFFFAPIHEGGLLGSSAAAGCLALLMAGWNLVRWYLRYQQRKASERQARNPLLEPNRRQRPEGPEENENDKPLS